MSRSRAAREKRIWPTKVLASKVKKWKWILRQFYFGEEIFEAECSWPKFIVNREDSYRRSIYIYTRPIVSQQSGWLTSLSSFGHFPERDSRFVRARGTDTNFGEDFPPPPNFQ